VSDYLKTEEQTSSYDACLCIYEY